MKKQNKRAEISFFDRFDREGGYDAFDNEGYLKILSYLTSKVPRRGTKTIIDMGCGTGEFTSRLAKAYSGSLVIGMDISPGCIKRASQTYPSIKFKLADAEGTKLPSSSVDLICYSGILHHFPDFSKVAKEAYRILKPGGYFFSYDPNKYNPAFWLYRSENSPFFSPAGITENERLLTAREIKNVFSREDFVVQVKVISGINVCYIENVRLQPLLTVYNFFDRLLGASPFANIFGAWLVGYGAKK